MSGLFKRSITSPSLANSTASPSSSRSPDTHQPKVLHRRHRSRSPSPESRGGIVTSPSKSRILSNVNPIGGAGSFHRPSGYAASIKSSGRRSISPPLSPSLASSSTTAATTGGGTPRSPSSPRPPPLPRSYSNGYSQLPYAAPPPSTARSARTQSISSLYPSPTAAGIPPLPSFASNPPKSVSLPNVRRAHKQAPPFTICLVGARGTGKTSWLNCLLGNVTLAGGSTSEKESRGKIREVNEDNTAVGGRARRKDQSISIEIVERGEKIALNVIDTEGLDVPLASERGGDNYAADLQVQSIVKLVEERFEESLKAVSPKTGACCFPL